MRILVCGDAMDDIYWTGTVSRISPEAPVPVVSVDNVEVRDGGAANVANTIEALGVEVERLFGWSAEPIRKIRLMAGKQHVARVDFDSPQMLIDPDVFNAALAPCAIVVFVDYAKGSLQNVEQLIRLAKARGAAVLVDPKGGDYARYSGATMIKPNIETFDSWKMMPNVLLAEGVIFKSILLTEGTRGMTLLSGDQITRFQAENAAPVDVSGAGEAAIAAYAAAMAKGMHPVACAQYASKAAGIACAHQGTYVVKGEELWN